MRILLFLFALLLCGCAGFSPGERPVLARDSHGNITRSQATEIANAYFYQEIFGSGKVLKPTLANNDWLFPYLVGSAGTPGSHPITVSRSTGGVSCPGYHPFPDPFPLLQAQTPIRR